MLPQYRVIRPSLVRKVTYVPAPSRSRMLSCTVSPSLVHPRHSSCHPRWSLRHLLCPLLMPPNWPQQTLLPNVRVLSPLLAVTQSTLRRGTFLASPSQSRDSFIFPSNTIQDGTPQTIPKTVPHPSFKYLQPFPSSFAPSSHNTNRGSPRFSSVFETDMDADEALSASTYTFDSSPTGPSAGAFTPRGVGPVLSPPSALSVLLARKQEAKKSRESLGNEHVTSETGLSPTSQTSLTPTNERQGNTFSPVATDVPRVLEPRSYPAASCGACFGQDQLGRTPDETTSLLPADCTTIRHQDAIDASHAALKTQMHHAKPVTQSDYGSTVLSKPSETSHHIFDPNIARKAVRAIPAVILGTLLNILDGVSCTYLHYRLLDLDRPPA